MFDLFPSRTIALEILGYPIHWYGLMYLFAFVLAWFLLPRLQSYRNLRLSQDAWSTLLSWAIIGVIVGGRLGYVFFYEPAYFLSHPLEILAVWNGGMASHGGFIGVGFAVFLFAKRRKIPLFSLLDVIVVPAALGLALGRIGNFINLELYGSVTTLPWGIEIPGVEGTRHPTQLYAVGKDLLIAVLMFLHLKRHTEGPHGRTTALFLLLYGILRFLIEFLRVPSHSGIAVFGILLTRGQWLSVLVVLLGIGLWIGIARIRDQAA